MFWNVLEERWKESTGQKILDFEDIIRSNWFFSKQRVLSLYTILYRQLHCNIMHTRCGLQFRGKDAFVREAQRHRLNCVYEDCEEKFVALEKCTLQIPQMQFRERSLRRRKLRSISHVILQSSLERFIVARRIICLSLRHSRLREKFTRVNFAYARLISEKYRPRAKRAIARYCIGTCFTVAQLSAKNNM